MFCPKINLLYFKNLLDLSFINFFKDYNDNFIKENDKYILAKKIGKTKLKTIFTKYILNELNNIILPFSRLNLNYYFIIGSCFPKNNFLLNFKNNKYFPEKLNKLINSDFQIKYFLKEKDIKLDYIEFNEIFLEVFNEFFTSSNYIQKEFQKKYPNVIFITHKYLDCYSLYKIIKYIFGKSNCINLYKEKFNNIKLPLVSINELIDLNIHNKNEINKSIKFKQYIKEISDFISEKINKI